MDYKYIEQLLERYWACETSLQEEQILRTFFQQAEVPAHLMAYKAVFDVQQEQAEATLGEDFDAKMIELISGQGEALPSEGAVKAIPFGGVGRWAAWRSSFRPLYQAAGLVALILTIGIAAQRSFDAADEPQHTQYAQIDSMESPVKEFVAMPEQQEAALSVEQDSINLTR
jgi:hypothetical protein